MNVCDMDPYDDEGSGDAGPVSAIHNRVRQLSRHQERPRSWSGDCGPRSRSLSSHRQMSPGHSKPPSPGPEDMSHVSESRDASPVKYRPVSGSRNHSLRYSGGALHGMDQPASFDHNFDSVPPDKASSSSPPRRPQRRPRDGSGTRESTQSPALTSVTHPSRQLPPLLRVQADLAAENLGSNR